jgi:two-component system, NtrC family, response regulator AtoC
LATHFLARFSRELNQEHAIPAFSLEAQLMLTHYRWPGNVRELENAIERAVILAEGGLIAPESLPEQIWDAPEKRPATSRSADPTADAVSFSLKRAIRDLEEVYIKSALRRTRGNRGRAAEILEISQRALLYKIKQYSIDPDAEGERP